MDNNNFDPLDIVAEQDQRIRFHEFVKEFHGIPQGDIILIRVPSHDPQDRAALEKIMQHPKRFGPNFRLGKLGVKTTNPQLVDGNSPGSRHTVRLADLDVVEIFSPDPETASPLEGPSLIASSRWVVEHPEHANHSNPEGCFVTIYERDLASEAMARTED